MGDEKHPNEDYANAERSRPPVGTALPPDVSGAAPERTAFDPSGHTVEDVQAHLEGADDDERARVLAAEKAGKNRSTLTA